MQTPLYVDSSGLYDETITRDECLTLGALMNPNGIVVELPTSTTTESLPKGCVVGYGDGTGNGIVEWNPNPAASIGCREPKVNGEGFYYCLRKRERKCVSSCDDPLFSPEGGCYSTCANDKLLTYDPRVVLDIYDVPYEKYISAGGTYDPTITKEECTTLQSIIRQNYIPMGCYYNTEGSGSYNWNEGDANGVAFNGCYNPQPENGRTFYCGKMKPLTCIDLSLIHI